jgi:hypothetical protein
VIGPEARIDFKHTDKAAAKQPRTNKKNQGKSHFRNHENAAQAIVREALGAATPGFLQEMAEAVTRGSKCGREPEEQSCEEGNAEREEQDTQVQSDFLYPRQLLRAGGDKQAHKPQARARPNAPPTSESSMLSVRSCRTMRRRAAPSAVRIAISRRRATALTVSGPCPAYNAAFRIMPN